MRSLLRHPGRLLRPGVLALAFAAGGAAFAAPAGAEPIKLMMGGMSKIIYLPAVLADRLGYFRDEGLDVRVLSVPAGIDTSTELIAGAIHGAVGFYDHTIDLQSRGQDVLSVVVFVRAAGLAELASTRPAAGAAMRSIDDARGRRLGVTGFGASTWLLTRYLTTRAGVAPGDYTVVPLASDTRFVEAIEHGTIDAGMVEEPAATRLLSSGAARVLVDLRGVDGTRAQLGGTYVGSCLYLRRSWALAHRDETGRMVHALVRALRFIAGHDAGQIAAVLPPEVVGKDRAGYVAALALAKPSFSVDGTMPRDAPDTVLHVLVSTGTGLMARHVDLSRTYTNAFVDGTQHEAFH
ncbi:ABC transporter substrate-binding protein [Burkholderia plantarii]|uniref:ABC nitrate/sulfonate/bicarbonatefamilytransporter, periplasmic ligand binding protein n=1 Tax=Burkholderia plantarii TaxID=41899 RepID=A0A0B6S5X4_BURPL|nr:ABC transporter substrate-binding protein [Burkholderia plantarii]AJK47646.1 ABC nitrate/sulfonate/bicarbonatefamilytransporter, periplasmic ligand binding protein [Burkholderia plantarii]